MGFGLTDLPQHPPPRVMFSVIASWFYGYHAIRRIRQTKPPHLLNFAALSAEFEGHFVAFCHASSLQCQVTPLHALN